MHFLIKWVSLIIELWGIFLIFIAVLKEAFRTIFKFKFKFNEIATDKTLGHGLAISLEFLLAAEILKTLIVRSKTQLIEVAALILIRILIAIILHWELKQKQESEKKIQERKKKE